MFTEREKVSNVPQEVNVIPENVIVPPNISEVVEAKDGTQAVSQQQNITTIPNTGSIQTAKDDSVTVTIPADPQVLQQQVKKGNVIDAATWLAAFWLRAFKQAVHFGWKIVQK